MFSAQRVRVTRKGKPGQEAWAVYRPGREPRYFQRSGILPWRPWRTRFHGAETEFHCRYRFGGVSSCWAPQDWGEKDAPDYKLPRERIGYG